MKIINLVLVAALAFSCTNNGTETIVTQSGIEISVLQKGNEEVEPGMMLVLDFKVKTASDSMLIDTSIDGMPRPARKVDSIWYANQGGIEEVIFNLKNGDSVFFKIPTSKIYGPNTPPQLTAEELLHVNLVVRDVMTKDEFQVYSKNLSEEKSILQLAKDIKKIDEYLSKNSIEAVKLESGLRYVITQTGEGENAQVGQNIKANYAGHVLDGEFFDSNIEAVAKDNGVYTEGRPYGPFETLLQEQSVIKGWVEGFQYLNKGSKATFYIPSSLAYGPRARSKQIGPNSVLVFDVELLEVQQ